MIVFGFVWAKKAEHSISMMCRDLEVSRSGYHTWAARAPSPRAVADAVLSARIGEIHSESLKTSGRRACMPSCASRTASRWAASAWSA